MCYFTCSRKRLFFFVGAYFFPSTSPFLFGSLQEAHSQALHCHCCRSSFQVSTHTRNYIAGWTVEFFYTVGYSLFPYALWMILQMVRWQGRVQFPLLLSLMLFQDRSLMFCMVISCDLIFYLSLSFSLSLFFTLDFWLIRTTLGRKLSNGEI